MDRDFEQKYLDWIYNQCIPEGKKYYKLLGLLHNKTFYPAWSMDDNRRSDGVNLRYKFGYNTNAPQHLIDQALADIECSCLEMMAALARIVGRELLANPEVEDEVMIASIFTDMLKSMGVYKYDDDHFDEPGALYIIERCFDTAYRPDGKGGLFYVPGVKNDMRTIEIWYQMQLFIRKKYF